MVIICTEYEKEALTQVILAHKNTCVFEKMCPRPPTEIGEISNLCGDDDDRWCTYCVENRIAWYIEKETV